MIRHLLKMVWNRRRANALIGLEILISFVVLFAVTAMALYQWNHYRKPLGFDWRGVWSIDFRTPGAGDGPSEVSRPDVEPLVQGLEELPAVEAAAALSMPLYSGSGWGWSFSRGDEQFRLRLVATLGQLDRVMDLALLRGRWFTEDDDVAGPRRHRALIGRSLARAYFGNDDPLGGRIRDEEDDYEIQVVGVIEDYRYQGELSQPRNMVLVYVPPGDDPVFLRSLAVRVRPGTPAAYEETILERLRALQPEWSFKVEPASAARDRYFRERLAPLLIASLVAGFLLLMVGLGLVGVLWQAVTRRTAELGVRRAQGAAVRHLLAQIQGEMLVLTVAAVAAGAAVVLQAPLVGWFPGLTPPILAGALALSAAGILLLSVVAASYPSWMATRIQPAEALHYD